MSNLTKNFKNGIMSYKITDELNSNNGYYEIGIDEVNSMILLNTNMQKFAFNKPVDFSCGLSVDGFTVLTPDNITGIQGISVDKIDGYDVNDSALATTEENNAIYTAKKIKTLLQTDIRPNNIQYTNAQYPAIRSVDDAINELLYAPVKITSFTSNKAVIERGAAALNVILSWSINKITVQEQKMDGVIIPVTDRTKTIPTLNSTTTYSLQVTTTVSFLNGRYFGVGINQTATNQDILAMNKELVESKAKTFTVTAAANEYIYFCIHKRLGTCTFYVGGFEGGFILLPELNFTNINGFTEPYYVYRSINKGLGVTTVSVS